MTYNKKNLPTAAKAEAIFPHWKSLTFLLLMLNVVQVAHAKSDVETQLKQHVEKELKNYLTKIGAQNAENDIAISLPSALENSRCSELDINRRQETDAPLGRLSYSLSCNAPDKWQGRATARVKAYTPVVVASRMLERGEVLSKDMLTLQKTDISTLRHHAELSPSNLYGLTVKRRISAASPVSRNLLETAYLVTKGSPISLKYQGDGFNIAINAIALNDGKLGERINVQNPSSGKILEAIVTGENTAQTSRK